jgi:hypothetical protein
MKLAFTICSNNFLSYALCLGNSLKEKNPEFHVVIALADKRASTVDYERFYPHEVIAVEEIGIPNLSWMTEHYNIVELNTAVKPYYFEFLFRKYNSEFIFFFDPDIYIYKELDSIISCFGQSDVLLTPHVIWPVPKGVYPWENHFLKYGIYNLGFIGLKNTGNVHLLLKWWQERLAEHCLINHRKGLFVDQLWANLIPLFFEKVCVLKDEGLNVAFWNLHERLLAKKDGRYTVNNTPLTFFHFSSFNPSRPDLLTKENYTNLDYNGNPSTVELSKEYAKALDSNNYKLYNAIQFAFVDRNKERQAREISETIMEKEALLDSLTLIRVNKESLIFLVYRLLKTYINYNNKIIDNPDDDRFNNVEYAFNERNKLDLKTCTNVRGVTRLKKLGSILRFLTKKHDGRES